MEGSQEYQRFRFPLSRFCTFACAIQRMQPRECPWTPPLFVLTQRGSVFKPVGHRWQLAGVCANQHVRFIQKTCGRTGVFGHAGQGDWPCVWSLSAQFRPAGCTFCLFHRKQLGPSLQIDSAFFFLVHTHTLSARTQTLRGSQSRMERFPPRATVMPWTQ